MQNLTIIPELKNLLPPLSESEFSGLEEDIQKRGCLSPIVVWGDIIVDGHNRYDICQAHGIPFETRALEFDSLDEAKLWAWLNQEHRRNLTLYQRTQIALQFKPLFEAQGKANQSLAGGDKKNNEEKALQQNSAEAITEKNTRNKIAKLAGASHDTVSRVEFLETHADDETRQRLASGKTSINKEYQRVKKVLDHDVVSVPVNSNDPESPMKEKVVRRITLRYISLVDPKPLVTSMMSWFDVSYRKNFVTDLLAGMMEHDGEEVVRDMLENMKQKYEF